MHTSSSCFKTRCLWISGLALFGGFCRVAWPDEPSLTLNVYKGVNDVVRLGDSESLVEQHAGKYKINKIDASNDPVAEKLKFNKIYQITDIGAIAYFRNGRVALILLQDPFRGVIQGKDLKVFSFAPPSGKTWEDQLTHSFGQPTVRASGGRFGSEALYYAWGDVSYNRMGPNEIAIYQDTDIASHRQRNFGRDVKLFNH